MILMFVYKSLIACIYVGAQQILFDCITLNSRLKNKARNIQISLKYCIYVKVVEKDILFVIFECFRLFHASTAAAAEGR